jgi:hypothetical protein
MAGKADKSLSVELELQQLLSALEKHQKLGKERGKSERQGGPVYNPFVFLCGMVV